MHITFVASSSVPDSQYVLSSKLATCGPRKTLAKYARPSLLDQSSPKCLMSKLIMASSNAWNFHNKIFGPWTWRCLIVEVQHNMTIPRELAAFCFETELADFDL